MIFPPKLYKIQILAKNSEKAEVIRQLHKLATVHITETQPTDELKKDTSLKGTNKIGEALLQLRYIADQTHTKHTTTLSKIPSPENAVSEAKEFIEKYLQPLEDLREYEQQYQQDLERIQARQELLEKIPFTIQENDDHTTLVYVSARPVKITMKHADIQTQKTSDGYYTKITLASKYVEQLEEAIKPTPLKKIDVSFVQEDIPTTKKLLVQRLQATQELLNNTQKQKTQLLQADTSHLQYLITSLENHYDAYTIPNKFAKTNSLFIITGYCEKKDFADLKAALPETVIHATPAKDNAPTKLKNSRPAKYFEPITQLFSTPKYAAIDPTRIVSIFFPIFFGLMFADIGYGLLTLALLPLLKQHVQEKWPIRILTLSSISTILFGVVFGSFFGGLIPITPLYAGAFDATMQLLILSITIGLIHMNLGAILNIIQGVRRKEYTVITQTLPFFTLQASVALYALQFIAIGHIVLAGTVALLIYNNGLFGIMDVTGYVGSVFSYARILALGLATAGVALAVNTIADKVLTLGALGIVLWLLIILLGHAFNFVVSIIGISINSARLHYVEFFSLFFDGGGELFAPFKRKNYMEVQ